MMNSIDPLEQAINEIQNTAKKFASLTHEVTLLSSDKVGEELAELCADATLKLETLAAELKTDYLAIQSQSK